VKSAVKRFDLGGFGGILEEVDACFDDHVSIRVYAAAAPARRCFDLDL